MAVNNGLQSLPSKVHSKKSKNALKRAKLKLQKLTNEMVVPPQRVDLNVIKQQIQLKNLDFDRERVCCVTLSKLNLFMCLTCGNIYQGRGESSPVYNHSIQLAPNDSNSVSSNLQHSLYISMKDSVILTIPSYEKIDVEKNDLLLNAIRLNCNPIITNLETQICKSYTGSHSEYFTGYVSLITDGADNGYMASVFYMFSHLPRVLKAFLLDKTIEHEITDFERELKKLFEKIWNQQLLKPCVSIIQFQNFLKANLPDIFKLPKEPQLFYLWIINQFTTHTINDAVDCSLRGHVLITQTPIDSETLLPNGKTKVLKTPFKILTIDLPTASVFKDRNMASTFEAESQDTLVFQKLIEDKFGKIQFTKDGRYQQTYKILETPDYLVLHFNRFDRGNTETRNKAFVEFSTENVEIFPGEFYDLQVNVFLDQSTYKTHFRTPDGGFVELDGLKYKKMDSSLLFLQESCVQLWKRCRDPA